MATFYLDLENGNDANAGTSWALAWKTFTSGATAARIAPGDEIRIAKSPAPTSVGNGTWTNLSATVTLATAQTTTLYNDGAWTAANSATVGTTTTRKEGTNAAQITTPASTVTSTKYAYYATGTLDLSAYNSITLWFRNNTSAIADANRYVIKLCSDTIGDTSVDEFSIPAIPSTSTYVPLTITKTGGGNLGNSIKSIALYTGTSSPGNSQQLWIDNVSACTNTGLHLRSLISKSSTEWNFDEIWHPLQFINGTTLSIGLTNNTVVGSSNIRGYYTTGTSPATVTTYFINPIPTTMVSGSTAVNTINDSGTSDIALITYSGGWDTATNTRTGMTFLDGQNNGGIGLYATGKSYNKVEYLGLVRYSTAIFLTSSSNFNRLSYIFTSGGGATQIDTGIRDFSNIIFSMVSGSLSYTARSIATPESQILDNIKYYGSLGGVSVTGNYSSISNYYHLNCDQRALLVNGANTNYDGITIDRSSNAGAILEFNSGYNNILNNISITNNNLNNNFLIGVTSQSNGLVYGLTTSGNTNVTSFLGGSGSAPISQIQFFNTTFAESTFVPSPSDGNTNLFTASINNGNNARLVVPINTTRHAVTALTQTTQRKTPSGLAWQINILSTNVRSSFPYNFPIAKIACNANALVTVKAWVKLSNATNIGAKLFVAKNQLDGMTSDVSSTKTADTNWEELTVTFTPTENGVVEIDLQTYWVASTANQSVYVDDVTITQA